MALQPGYQKKDIATMQWKVADMDNNTNTSTSQNISRVADEHMPIQVVTAFTILAAFAVVINSIHLFVLGKQRQLKKTENNNYRLFLMTLGALDLGVNIPRLILSNDYFQTQLEKHDWLCSLSGCFVHFVYITQCNILLMVSIDRTYSLHNSVKKYKSVTFIKYYPQITGGIIFIFFTVYLTLAVVYNGTGFSTKDMGGCNLGSLTVPWLGAPTAFVILLDLLSITSLYGYIIFIIRLRKAKLNQTLGQRKSSLLKAVRTIGCILVASWTCWVPPILSAALWAFGVPSVPLEVTALLMVEINSLANPLIYGLTNSAYRAVLFQIFLGKCYRRGRTYPLSGNEQAKAS